MGGGNWIMHSVDERVVELRLYNQQFENGIRSSVASLNNLKAGLNLDGATRSLSNLDRAGKSFSLAGIAEGVNNLSNKFSTLGIIGITALQNITNSAINTGKQLIASLTINPIKTGLEEYETKMNAITTVLTNTASKGTTLDDVNKALNELNIYADKTIYNFAEMTRNIGTFTAAGVDLKTSTTSIKGIANLAAGSGSSALQASTAMYQLSQAIASGAVKLMDWNSVVNAGMGGELFQKALEKTAKELGHGRNMAISFRESLESGWITTEVLTKTLAKFAADESLIKAATQVKTLTQLLSTMKESVQSGWAHTWEHVIGDREEAAGFFTAINDGFGAIAGASAEARNEMLVFWKANDGRYAIIEALFNSFKGLKEILDPIGQAFSDIFPPMTGERLVKISKSIRDLSRNFKIGDETAANIKSTFKGLFAILDIGKQALFAIAGGLSSVIQYLIPAGGGFLAITGSIGEFLTSIDKAIKSSDSFNVAIQKIGNLIKPIADVVKMAIGGIVNAFKSLGDIDTAGLDSFSEHVATTFKPFEKLGEMVDAVFAGILVGLKGVAPTFYKIADIIGGAFSKLGASITSAIDNSDFNSIVNMINGGVFTAILLGLGKFVKSITSIADDAGDFLGGITGILSGVRGSLEAYQSSLKAAILLKIAIAIGILAVALVAIASIDSNKLASSLAAMTTMFLQLFGAMALFEKVSGGLGFMVMARITTAMLGLSVAILILAHAMTVLSKIDKEGMQQGLTAVAALTGILLISAKVLSGISGSLIRASIGFIIFGTAIRVLVSSVKSLSTVDKAGLTNGLIGVGVLMAELALFMKVADLSGMGVTKSVGIVVLAIAINVLGVAVKKFSEIDTVALIKGLLGVGVVLAEVAIFVNLTGNVKNVISTALSLTILGAAMIIFAKAISNMGKMSWDEIARGLTTLAGALGIIVVTFKTLPKNILFQSLAMLDIATTITILAKALSTLGKMSWEEISKGLLAMAGSLGIIVATFALMKNKILDATALFILVGALLILAQVLQTLGSMSLVAIGTSLLALAGAFGVIGLAGLLLAPLTPAILALAGAIAILGIGCLAVGVGLLAFSAGLAALAVSGTAGAVALVAVVTSIVGLIPFIFKTIAKGIIDFAIIIGEGAPTIANAMKDVMMAMHQIIVEVGPQIITTIATLILSILDTLVASVPKMIDSGMKLILGILKGITSLIKEVVEAGIDVILQFIAGVVSKLPAIVDAAFKVIIAFINGLADAIRNNHQQLYDAVGNLITAIVEAVIDLLPKIIDVGGNIIKGLIKGIVNMAGSLSKAITGIIGEAIDSAERFLGIKSPSKVFTEMGIRSGEQLIDGLKSTQSEASRTAGNLGKAVNESAANALGIASPSKVFQDYGANIVAGLKNGIKQDTPKAVEESKTMATKVTDASNKELAKSTNTTREASKTRQQINKEEFDKSIKLIDDRKYYNQLSLMEELSAWQNIQSKYAAGTEEREKADREVYRLKKEMLEKQKTLEDDYYAKTKGINEKLKQDIRSVNDEYRQAVKSRADSLYKTYGLFDELGESEAVSGAELVINLETQVAAFDEWQKNIKSLSKKGISDGLLKELEEMGPTALEKVKALNSLLKPELDKYVALWKDKHKQSKGEAVRELGDMREQSDKKITQLNSQTDTQLVELKDVYQTQLAAITTNTQEQLAEFNSKWETKVKDLNTQTNNDFAKIVTDTQNIFKQPDWISVGVNIIDGITQGVKRQAVLLAKATSDAAKQALNAANETLGIQSPSKEFAKVGQYAMEGFAGGLRQFSGVVVSEITNVAVTAKDSLKSAISNIASIVSGNMDIQPTIRPVIDLTNINKGLSSAFNRSQSINIDDIRSKTASISSMDANRRAGSDSNITKSSTNGVSGSNQGGGLAVTVTNFINNRTQDVQALAEELEFYRQQIIAGRGGN